MKEASNQKFIKQTPLEVFILIKNTILQFSKAKNQNKKDPLKFQKIKKIQNKASNQKVL